MNVELEGPAFFQRHREQRGRLIKPTLYICKGFRSLSHTFKNDTTSPPAKCLLHSRQFLDKTHQFSSPHTVQSLHIPARSWYLPRETKDCTSHIPTRPATHIHKACLWLQCRHHRFHFGLAVPTFYLLLLGKSCASVSRLFSVPSPSY